MAVIRDVIRGIIRPVIRDVIRDVGGTEPQPGDPPVWTKFINNYPVYENELPFTLELSGYVSTPAGEPVTTWVCTAPATMEAGAVANSLLTLNTVVGVYPITVTATNVNGSANSNQFTIEVLAGEVPQVPEWGTIPDFYSVYGIAGGNQAPPIPAPAAQVLAADEGIDMNAYITAGQPITGWSVTPGGVATIDNQTGVLSGLPGTVPGDYYLTVTATNAEGSTPSPQIYWKVYPTDGVSVDFSVATTEAHLGGFSYSRIGSNVTVRNYLAEDESIDTSRLTLVGHRWSGAVWMDESVGYGIQTFEAPDTTTISADITQSETTPDGFEIENCGQVVFRKTVDITGGEGKKFFSFTGGEAEIALYGGVTDNTIVFGIKATTAEGFIETPAFTLPHAIGDQVDLRYKYNKGDGLKLWVDGVLAASNATPSAVLQQDGLTVLDIGDSSMVCAYFKIIPTGYVEDSVIEAWPTWEQPLPIIVQQPPDSVSISPQDPLPSGAPYITGSPEVGNVLTANTSQLTDPTGTITDFSYFWYANGVEVSRSEHPGAVNTYQCVADDSGKTITVAVTYVNGNGDTVAPPTSSPTAPVDDPTGLPPQPAKPVILNWNKPCDTAVSVVKEGDTIRAFMDVANAVAGHIELSWTETAPFQNEDPPRTVQTYEERYAWGHSNTGTQLISEPWDWQNPQIPGVEITTGPIPPYDVDVDRDGREADFDRNGIRVFLKIPNAPYGKDCHLHLRATNEHGTEPSYKDSLIRVRVYPGSTWNDWLDIPNIYGFWSIERKDHRSHRGMYRKDVNEVWGDWHMGDQWPYKSPEMIDFDVSTGVISSVTNWKEDGNDLVAYGADSFDRVASIRMEHRVSACTKAHSVYGNHQCGLKHDYAAAYDSTGGWTIVIPDWRFYPDDAGAIIHVLDDAGSDYIKVTTSAEKYWIEVGGGAPQDTGFSVAHCDVNVLTLTVTPQNEIKFWASLLPTIPNWNTTPFTTSNTHGNKNIGGFSLLANNDATATDTVFSLFALATVIHSEVSDTDISSFCSLSYEYLYWRASQTADYALTGNINTGREYYKDPL